MTTMAELRAGFDDIRRRLRGLDSRLRDARSADLPHEEAMELIHEAELTLAALERCYRAQMGVVQSHPELWEGLSEQELLERLGLDKARVGRPRKVSLQDDILEVEMVHEQLAEIVRRKRWDIGPEWWGLPPGPTVALGGDGAAKGKYYRALTRLKRIWQAGLSLRALKRFATGPLPEADQRYVGEWLDVDAVMRKPLPRNN